MHPRRRLVAGLLSAATMLAAGGTAAATPLPQATDPVVALNRHASPLTATEPGGDTADLGPLGRMIGAAPVVGAGEATHSSHEFFSTKHRLFRYLVEEKGFRAFVLEAPWSTGLALDRYVVHGAGDPREIMRREFQSSYRFWNTQEYLDLVEWMRAYNRTHARKIHFVGNDLGYVGPEAIDRVTSYVGKHRPELSGEFTAAYAGIRSDAEVDPWTEAYFTKTLAERVRIETVTRRAVVRLEREFAPSAARTWAIQHARTVWQVAKLYSHDLEDPDQLPVAMRFRDEVMADNTIWWWRHTGHKALLSAHNGHVGYVAAQPEQYPKLQGAFLRDKIGRNYVAIGFSFDRGGLNAWAEEDPLGSPPRSYVVPPAPPGSNEHTLDRVRYDDYFVDLRTLPRGTRQWLDVERPTRSIGTVYPTDPVMQAIGPSFDLLIHLDEIRRADLRG